MTKPVLRCGCSQSFATSWCADCQEYVCGTHWKVHAGHQVRVARKSA